MDTRERSTDLEYIEDLKSIVNSGNIPKHVAIIMDGNGRWAVERKRPRVWGHRKGVDSVKKVVEAAGEVGVEVLTLFAFSDENWGRPKLEVKAILSLLDTFVVKEREDLNKNNVRLQTIGDLSQLPEKSQKLIAETKDYLKNNTGLILNIALSYGSRGEIVQAAKKIAQDVLDKKITVDEINKQLISDNLYTNELPELDLLIRTSGELRISNFLLWQLAYSELYFTKMYWPDFGKIEFLKSIKTFQLRKRRFGLLDEDIDEVFGTMSSSDTKNQSDSELNLC